MQYLIQDHEYCPLGPQVRALLLSKQVRKTTSGKRRGRFDPKKSVKLTNEIEYERLYRQRVPSQVNKKPVSLLVDVSGSMRGKKARVAITAALSMAKLLENLHVPYEVAAFGNNNHFICKGWYASKTLLQINENLDKAFAASIQNVDGEALMISWEHLRKFLRPGEKGLMIVFSDGAPAGHHPSLRGYYNLYEFTQNVARAIHADPFVDLIGIGIMDMNVVDIYPINEVVWEVTDLEPKLLTIIKEHFLQVNV